MSSTGNDSLDNMRGNVRGDEVVETLEQGHSKLSSRYLRDGEAMREKLKEVSPTFCLAKWTQVSIHLTTGRTQSCYHPPTHRIPLEEIAENPSALHNTRLKMEQRRLMKEGKRPAECQYCWNFEDLPGSHLSDRHYRSAELWSKETFEEVAGSPWDYDVKPRYVEVNFNHACQFRCSYCSPHVSSAWMEEILSEGAYPTRTPHNGLEWVKSQGLMPYRQAEQNPYVEAFWKWWPEIYPTLRVFRMTGGEPLIDPNTYRVFDYIIEHPKSDLILSLTSNMCPRPQFFDKFIDRSKRITDGKLIDHFQLFVSLDSWGPQAAYIRNGMDFDYLLANVNRFLSDVRASSITFIVTFNNLSVVGWKRMVDGILELRQKYSTNFERVWIDTPILRHPKWQSLQILPERYRDILREAIDYMKGCVETRNNRFTGIKDFEIAKIERVLGWMSQTLPPDRLASDRADFYRFFREYDRRKGTRFLATFPEMRDFWELCELEGLEALEREALGRRYAPLRK